MPVEAFLASADQSYIRHNIVRLISIGLDMTFAVFHCIPRAVSHQSFAFRSNYKWFESSLVAPSVLYCELFAGKCRCKEPAGRDAKFNITGCRLPTQSVRPHQPPTARPIYHPTLMINSPKLNMAAVSKVRCHYLQDRRRRPERTGSSHSHHRTQLSDGTHSPPDADHPRTGGVAPVAQ